MITRTHGGYQSPVLPGQVFQDPSECQNRIQERERELAAEIGRVPTIREFIDNEIDRSVRMPADQGWFFSLNCEPLTLDKPKPTVADLLEREEQLKNETRAQRARREQDEREQAEADAAELRGLRDTPTRAYHVRRIERVVDKNRWNPRLDRGRWDELKTAVEIARRDRDEAKIVKLADRMEAEQNQRDREHNAAVRAQIGRLESKLC